MGNGKFNPITYNISQISEIYRRANRIRAYTDSHAPTRVEDSPVVEIPGEWNSHLHKRNLPTPVEEI
ncbi:hypothetical protein QT970_07770 [Microcoleus sp. herbarium8]|uniref:hypothetical protein n=1 Tax=Microcoleus sp. herbarium8 TaxID=3055436 RepID=UPI002FD6FD9F